jgi:hypothetical protein
MPDEPLIVTPEILVYMDSPRNSSPEMAGDNLAFVDRVSTAEQLLPLKIYEDCAYQIAAANESLQPTPRRGCSSAARFSFLGPAWLRL